MPDLRRTSPEVQAALESIVQGGARKALGMPSFATDLTPAQVRLIQAYVLDQAVVASRRAKGRRERARRIAARANGLAPSGEFAAGPRGVPFVHRPHHARRMPRRLCR